MASLAASRWTAFVSLFCYVNAHSASDISGLAAQCGPGEALSVQDQGHSCPMSLSQTASSNSTRWDPWTHAPFCAETEYCVFTNSIFQNNHGVSMITTRKAAESALPVLRSAFAAPPLSTSSRLGDVPAWKVWDIEGKGKGVVAVRKIARGEVFMVDYASVLADVKFPVKVNRKIGRKLLDSAVDRLPDPQKILALGKSSNSKAPASEDVLRTNTFSTTVDGIEYMVLFPTVSRINHACNPNAFTRILGKTLNTRVVAFRDIEPGEEITISYTEFGLLYKERQKTLLRRWGFKCSCDLCSASRDEIAASDARRTRITGIREEVFKAISKRDFIEAIDLYKELMDLVKKEQLVSHWGEHYEVLARLHAAVGDKAGAINYAKLAVETLTKYGGLEIYESITELEELLAGYENA